MWFKKRVAGQAAAPRVRHALLVRNLAHASTQHHLCCTACGGQDWRILQRNMLNQAQQYSSQSRCRSCMVVV